MRDTDNTANFPGITVKSVGVGWNHPSGFCIDRPGGIGSYTFVQWLTPARLRLNGKMRLESGGGCIIYCPGDPHWYASDAYTPFSNHWFHFDGVACQPLLEELEIPLNQPFFPRDTSLVEPTLRRFLEEVMTNRFGARWELSALAGSLLTALGRQLRFAHRQSVSARNQELFERFERFRDRLRANCSEPWTLAKMAGELHLSASRFSSLYREFFSAKPVDDLIHMRINLAEYYLRTTRIPISYVAHLCGFADTYYFSRVFKAKAGKTATAYRNDNNVWEMPATAE